MKIPFVKASCGCIVVPLHRPSNNVAGHMDCILLKACDGEGGWSFSIRAMEPWKVVYDPAHKYKNQPTPVPLTQCQAEIVIDAIGKLVIMGTLVAEVNRNMELINKMAQQSTRWPSE